VAVSDVDWLKPSWLVSGLVEYCRRAQAQVMVTGATDIRSRRGARLAMQEVGRPGTRSADSQVRVVLVDPVWPEPGTSTREHIESADGKLLRWETWHTQLGGGGQRISRRGVEASLCGRIFVVRPSWSYRRPILMVRLLFTLQSSCTNTRSRYEYRRPSC